jgi:hypothetical protein
MPTLNPRLTITLQPQLAAQLRRLSELTGNSQSKLISEMLEGSGPVFDRLITVLTAASEAKEAMRGKLSASIEQGQARVEAQLGLVLEDFTDATEDLLQEAEAIKRRARRVAPAKRVRSAAPGFVTPLSNRGVRSTKNTGKTTKGRGH